MADRTGGKAGDAGTKVDQPSDQEGKGTPDKEALETTESAEAVGQQEAAEKAEAPEPKPKKPKAEPKAEDTATAETKVDKAGADEARKARPRARGAKVAAGTAAAAPVVRAQAKYVRTSARKARLVCDHIRGKSVDEARAILAFTPRAVAKDWAKLLDSAVANAEHNHELLGDDLVVQTAYADEGPTLKRFQPRAMGRATRIRKRTSHLTITLTPKG
jgi:ribosomal protein L22